MIGVWVCGHEKVEEDGRDAGALRDNRPRVSLKESGVIVWLHYSVTIVMGPNQIKALKSFKRHDSMISFLLFYYL